ncbi:MAG: PKD domain-containing protein [Terriglobia bacterium]|nr:PKD domain-containing protein [Terriglobia bacterium]
MLYRRTALLGVILVLLAFISGCGKSSGSGGAPSIASLSVSKVTVGSQATTITVTGANFTKSSVVNFNGTALTTTYTSPTQVSATIPASSLTTAGTFGVTVTDGGRTSNSVNFTVSSAAPTISSLNPGNVTAGSAGFVLTVTGSGFNPTSTINWNGNAISTTYLDSSQLNADIPASLVASSASVPITVTTGSSGTSTAQNFLINAPVPVLTGINPTTVYAGSGDITLTVNGSHFLPNSTVQLGGSSRTTVFISSSQLTASITAADLASVGTPAVTVVNSAPQGGTSNPVQLNIVTRPANQPPVANAGLDETVAVGSTVNLSGYGSSDGNGSPLTFQWTMASAPSGSTATLSNASSPTPSFVADVAGNYLVQLVVRNGTATSAPAIVTISTVNSMPVANAGFNQTAKIGVTIQLDGTHSTDFDGNHLTYKWTLVSPSGSSAALSSTTSPQPTFVVDKAGTYQADLIVNDGIVDSHISRVYIDTSNSAPIANAGRNQAVQVGATAHLDGSASSDFEGDPLTYSWAITSAPAGSSAGLSNANSIRPTFVADKAGTYLVQLIVNDGTVNSVASTMTVSTVNTPPVASAGRDRTVTTGSDVLLDGSASTDANGNALSYRWALIARPSGSTATLSSAASVQPSFTADVAGTYVAQLIVNDGTANSAPSTVTISTTNSAPVANAGPGQTVAAGATVQLDGSGSTDVDGNALQFYWALLSKPAGSAAVLSDPTVPNPVFVADKAGDYVAQLMVNDGHFYSSASTVTISTSPVAPIANAGKPQHATVGGAVQLDGSGSFDPGGGTLSYAWALVSKPAGSTAALSSSTGQKPSFTADIAGDYVAELFVSNGIVTSAPATVLVSTVYAPPSASAGSNQSVNVGSAANLDASGSSSPEGYSLTYKWSLIGLPLGSTAALNDPTSQTPSFTLDKRGTYIAQVIVNDGHSDSAPRTVIITSSNRAPVANAGPDQSPSVGSTVTLDGTGSTDPDGYGLTYQWRFTSIPNGSTATLAGATTSKPTFAADLQGTYTVELVVSDGLLTSTPDTVNITVGPNTNISFSPSPLDMNGNSTATLILTLGQTAGSGGVTVNLTSSNTSVATVPASVTVSSGSSTTSVTVTSVSAAGSTTITGTASGYTTGSVTVNVTVNSMTVPNITVGKDLQGSAAVTFGVVTGASTDITVTTTDTSKILLSNSATAKGSDTVKVTAAAGSKTSPSFFVQALTDTGTATLTIKASGYLDTTATVTLAPSGFIIRNGTSDTLNTSVFAADSTLTVLPAYLDPTTKNVLGTETLRGGMSSQTIKLTNSDKTVGTISTSSISLGAGTPYATLTFHPLATGTTNITVTEPSGFTTPANFQVMKVNVGNATVTMNPLTVGKDLQGVDTIYLGDPAPSPDGVDVTITSSDPSKVVVSSDPVTAGAATTTVHVNGGTRGLPQFYVQALASSGTVTLTASGTNLTDGTTTITLAPSGFVIVNSGINSGSTGDSTVTLATAVLNSSLVPTGTSQGVRPGAAPVNLGITSSNTGVATVTSPISFAANVASATSTFHPVSGGTTTVAIQTPSGFSTPTQYQSITANVGLPGMTTKTAFTIGKDLQQPNTVTLNTAPASPVAVTVTSNSTAVAVLSTDPASAGTGSLTFNNITGSTPNFYIQGISIGSTTLTVSAPGYADTTIHVTVNPSGFIMDTGSFNANVNDTKTVNIAPAVLDSTTLNYIGLQPLRGGVSASVGLTSSNTAVGTITTPVAFASNQSVGSATFHALADGETTLATVAPAGFSTPMTYGSITASVGLPGLTTNTQVTVGKDLQQSNTVTLSTTPTTPVDVTIASSSTSVATVSTDPTVAGTGTVTFSSISSTTPNFYIQGISQGTTTLTVTATGYATTTINVTVNPSGFIITSADFNAITGSDTPVGVASALLDANSNFLVVQPVRGGISIQVPMSSDNTSAGTITTPVTLSSSQSAGSATFHAVAVGTTHVNVGTPTGYNTPTSRTSVTATVQ